MAGEWEDLTLGDLGRVVTGKTPLTSVEGNFGGRIPFVTPSDMDGRKTISTTARFLTQAGAASIKGSVIPAGAIMVSCIGSDMGKVVVAGCECVTNQQINSIVVDDRFSSEFVYYSLSTRKDEIRHQAAGGSAVPILNKGDFSRMEITLPPLAEQKAIAAVLGALDDKIELNRRMNATLEAMARALFQSWFVDFDPVRAKLDGRPPAALAPATAALFPEHFQDSQAGHIPKGWTVGKVSDLATLNRGAVNPGDFPTETFDHFSLPAFDNGRTPKAELGSAIMSNKFTVKPNSVLLSKLNPHIPRIWLPDLHASRRSVCSTEFMVACSKPGVSREYLFSLFTSSAFASIYGTLVTGTTGSHQRIRPESVLDMKIVIPSSALIRAFTDSAKPMFDRINRNTEQSRTLATLRDTLLPKLLSGELSVHGASNI